MEIKNISGLDYEITQQINRYINNGYKVEILSTQVDTVNSNIIIAVIKITN